jgi:hypothetical protein
MNAALPFSDPGGGVVNAPIGSEAWAQRVRLEMQAIVKDLAKAPERFAGYIELCQAHRAWALMNKRDGSKFTGLEEFCEYPEPWGLGRPWKVIKPYLVALHGKAAVAAQVAPLAPVGAPLGSRNNPVGRAANTQPEQDETGSNVDDVNISSSAEPKGGNSTEYLAARIKRDAPEVAEALGRGEYSSVRQAAIAAGVVKPKTPLQKIESLGWKLSREDLQAAIVLLTGIFEDRPDVRAARGKAGKRSPR